MLQKTNMSSPGVSSGASVKKGKNTRQINLEPELKCYNTAKKSSQVIFLVSVSWFCPWVKNALPIAGWKWKPTAILTVSLSVRVDCPVQQPATCTHLCCNTQTYLWGSSLSKWINRNKGRKKSQGGGLEKNSEKQCIIRGGKKISTKT